MLKKTVKIIDNNDEIFITLAILNPPYCSITRNMSNTDDLSYFLSIIVAVVYGKFAVIQFWQNL